MFPCNDSGCLSLKIFRLTAESTHYNNDLAIDIGFAPHRRWLLVLFVLALAGLLLWLLAEPPVSAEANEWIEQATDQSPQGRRAYAHLLGVYAPPGADPVGFGRQQIAGTVPSAAKNPDTNEALKGVDSGAEKVATTKIELPFGENYCRIRQEKCLRSLLTDVQTLRVEVSKHRELLDRYRQFLQHNSFQSIDGNGNGVLPATYAYLLAADKLSQFDIISTAAAGKVSAATEMLGDQIARLRRILAIVDSLQLKMVAVSLLVDNLDLAAGLFSRNYINQLVDSNGADPLVELRPSEGSLIGPLRQEFVTHVRAFKRYNADSKSLAALAAGTNTADSADQSDDEKQPSIVSRILGDLSFGLNRSINSTYKEYRKLLVRATLPTVIVDDAFVGQPGRVTHVDKPLFDVFDLSNRILRESERVDIEPFVFRLRDLDSKLKLLRIRMQGPNFVTRPILDLIPDSVDISNPYNPQESVSYDASANTLCFDGPREDHHGTRCIVVD